MICVRLRTHYLRMRTSFEQVVFGTFMMLSLSAATPQGFTDYYNPDNWTIELPEAEFGGSIGTFDANTLVINGPDGDFCPDGKEVSVSIVIPISGTVSFDWEFFSEDLPGWDFFVVRTCNQGNPTELLEITGNSSGVFSEHFTKGERLSLVVLSTDCIYGEGIATITNFSAPQLIKVFQLNIQTAGEDI